MKRRIRKIVNFFAFNLLFFALYLNFIHKDKGVTLPVAVQTNGPSITGTVPVKDAEKYLNAKPAASVSQPVEKNEQDNETSKLSINWVLVDHSLIKTAPTRVGALLIKKGP